MYKYRYTSKACLVSHCTIYITFTPFQACQNVYLPEARALMRCKYWEIVQLVSTSQSSTLFRYCSMSETRPGNTFSCHKNNDNRLRREDTTASPLVVWIQLKVLTLIYHSHIGQAPIPFT